MTADWRREWRDAFDEAEQLLESGHPDVIEVEAEVILEAFLALEKAEAMWKREAGLARKALAGESGSGLCPRTTGGAAT